MLESASKIIEQERKRRLEEIGKQDARLKKNRLRYAVMFIFKAWLNNHKLSYNYKGQVHQARLEGHKLVLSAKAWSQGSF